MTILHRTIKLDIQGYWLVGSGRGEGYHLDVVCLKDGYGLPFVSGKQLKGLLRHAVRRAEQWGWYQDLNLPEGSVQSVEGLLFGSENQLKSRFDTFPGILLVDNATLPDNEYEFLKQPQQVALRQQMFDALYQTAIDAETGTAVEHSLRGIEVALPCQLHAELSLRVTAVDELLSAQQMESIQTDIWRLIELALPLIDAIGAHRSRGLGEVIVTLAA